MSAKQIIIVVCVVLMSISSASAKAWRGIEPLHSTRADVQRLLGPPTDAKLMRGAWMYDFPEERAFVYFASGEPCEEGLPGGWKVPKDIVVSIDTSLSIPKKTEEVLTAGKEYETIQAADTPGIFYYIDSDKGMRFNVFGDFVQSIGYGPTAKEKDYNCGEYRYAAPVVPGVKLKKAEQATLDSFGAIRFIDAQARLDNFVINLFKLKEDDPGWRGYIIVYAGRRSYLGEAQFKANCYKSYLVRVRKMDPKSVFAVDGGFRDEFQVELYLGSGDYYPPVLVPTISPKKVQVINRRLKSCNERTAQP